MGIAMTIARVPGPGNLRTLRKGSRGDDGVQGRERRATHDRCRRSRDVRKLRWKSRIAVYRNEEIVFPFVLRQLGHGYMTKNVKNNIMYYLIFYFFLHISMSQPPQYKREYHFHISIYGYS